MIKSQAGVRRMKPPGKRPQRKISKRPLPPAVPEYTCAPAKPAPTTEKETARDEAIRKMLEAAYT
jgi:hypothetical protein